MPEVAITYNHYQRVSVLHLPCSCGLLLLILVRLGFLDEAAKMKSKKYLKVFLK